MDRFFNRFFFPFALALILGGLIYIFLRPSEAIFFNWLKSIGFYERLMPLRLNFIHLSKSLPAWFIYSIPNGLWAFAYSLFITCIWWYNKNWVKIIWISSIPLLILGFEVLQFTETIPGTFCWQDIFFGALGLTLGIIVGIKPKYKHNYENKRIKEPYS